MPAGRASILAPVVISGYIASFPEGESGCVHRYVSLTPLLISDEAVPAYDRRRTAAASRVCDGGRAPLWRGSAHDRVHMT